MHGDPVSQRGGSPVRLGSILPGALEKLGSPGIWIEARVRNAWPSAVGAQLASRTRVLRLRKGCLEVAVRDDVWATEVRYLAGEIARKLNEILGEPVVREVVTRRVRKGT